MMHVRPIKTQQGQQCYIVVNDDGEIVVSVARYLKYLLRIGRKLNTIRTYAYGLRSFFEYCHKNELEPSKITLDDMADFIYYLKTPPLDNTTNFLPIESARSATTINNIIAAVSGFYDHMWRSEETDNDINEKMTTYVPARFKSFKSFLHHITAGQPIQSNVLRQKTPRQTKPKVLSKDQINSLYATCGNERDRLLITLLFESGLRIGEVLGLRLEDVDIMNCSLKVFDRGTLENGASFKTAASERNVEVSRELINRIMDWVADAPADCEHDFLFTTLQGKNSGEPLNYHTIVALFRRLKDKTGIDANAHMLRHSHLTALAEAGWRPELLQKRAGHANYQTTFNTYVHPSDDSLRAAWEQTQDTVKLQIEDNSNEISI